MKKGKQNKIEKSISKQILFQVQILSQGPGLLGQSNRPSPSPEIQGPVPGMQFAIWGLTQQPLV